MDGWGDASPQHCAIPLLVQDTRCRCPPPHFQGITWRFSLTYFFYIVLQKNKVLPFSKSTLLQVNCMTSQLVTNWPDAGQASRDTNSLGPGENHAKSGIKSGPHPPGRLTPVFAQQLHVLDYLKGKCTRSQPAHASLAAMDATVRLRGMEHTDVPPSPLPCGDAQSAGVASPTRTCPTIASCLGPCSANHC